MYADLTAVLQRCSRAEGLRITATHLPCVYGEPVRGAAHAAHVTAAVSPCKRVLTH